jgi:hypothetical protein
MTVVDVLLATWPPPPTVVASDGTPGRNITSALNTILGSLTATETVIEFPRLRPHQVYVLDATVALPANRRVILRSRSPRGAALQALNPFPSLFSSAAAPNADKTFQDLVFKGSGIMLHPGKGKTTVERCAFHLIPSGEWGIRTSDFGVDNVSVVECEFSEMDGGGILVGHSRCDGWLIGENSIFVRLDGPGVEIHSGGVRVRDARFENRLHVHTNPYLRVMGEQAGARRTTIENCRFGGEKTSKTVGPPTSCIELSSRSIGVTVTSSMFLGFTDTRTPPADDDSAKHAIKLAKGAHACSITSCYFRLHQYSDVLIASNGVGAGGPSRFLGNSVSLLPEPGLKRPPKMTELFGPNVIDWVVDPVTA